jgi:hypothetical protein
VAVETDGGDTLAAHHDLSERELSILRAGGTVPWMRARLHGQGQR